MSRQLRRTIAQAPDAAEFLEALEAQQAARNRMSYAVEVPLNFGSEQKAKNDYRNENTLEKVR